MTDPPVLPALPTKQLFMVADASRARKLAAPELPAGYQLREFRPGDQTGWVKLLAAIGSMPGDEPPQMIEIEAVGATAILFENRSMMP